MSTNIRRQRNGICITDIGNQIILAVFFHKAESIFSVDILKIGIRIPIGSLSFFIDNYSRILCDKTVFI